MTDSPPIADRRRPPRRARSAPRIVCGFLAALTLTATGVGRDTPAVAAPPSAQTAVIVTFREQADTAGVRGSRATRLREVVRRQTTVAELTQRPFRARLAAWQRTGRVTRVAPLWVINGLSITATPDVIASLAADPAVASVTPDAGFAAPVPTSSGTGVEQHVARIGAADVWALGDTGEGIVVATLDTGVDGGHPDLSGRWRGGTNSWFDPFGEHATPADLNGHGTQVMGAIVGGNAGGSSVGVAPGARWIAARIFDDAGRGSVSTTHLAFQWLLDPDGDPATADAPHVVNASWTFGSPGCRLDFAPDIQALRAAGILPVFAAGNFGPADASPANNPGALAVGSTTISDTIASDSSRGPSACGEPQTTFPEITAPGVNVLTTDLGGLYYTPSGTSMAAPHVAGALALLLSAFPGLTAAQQEAAILQTAVDLGPPGPDDTFGAGRLDVFAAYRSIGLPPADRTPPTVDGVEATAATGYGTGAIVLTATARDKSSALAGGEWYEGVDPGPGRGVAMAAADGAFDGREERLMASIASTELTDGAHTLSIRATDSRGNRSAPVTTTVLIARTDPGPGAGAAPPGPLPADGRASTPTPVPAPPNDGSPSAATARTDEGFADGFDTGDVSAWPAVVGWPRRLGVATAPRRRGAFAMWSSFSGIAPAYVEHRVPAGSPAYASSFDFHPHGAGTGGAAVAILTGVETRASHPPLFRVEYRRLARPTRYQVRLAVSNREKTAACGWVTVTNAYHRVEMRWEAAVNASASLDIDRRRLCTLNGLDTRTRTFAAVRLGRAGGVSGTGSAFFDSFTATTRAG